MLIERPPRLYRALFPGSVWRIGRDKTVYLTFDDGPIPEATPWVLDCLDQYGAKATFFMVGDNADRHPELVAEVLRRGHAIGNHTMHHTQGLHTDSDAYIADVQRAADTLPPTRLFRPPHGFMRPAQVRKIKALGYQITMHDVVTRDYDPSLSPARILMNVKRYVRPGSIIVMHDSIKAWKNTSAALPHILAWLTAQGYRLAPLPQPTSTSLH